MCLNPKWIYKSGRRTEASFRGEAGSLYEIGTYSKCGYCEQCINSRCNDWVVRNYYESMAHKRKCFITLTYEDSSFILVRKDFQDWLKRFRTELDRSSGEKVRFFHAGEYGTARGRPHGHFIVYGWDDEKAKYLTINKKKEIVYQSKIIQKTWGLGRTSYQPFADNEIPYVTLYDTPQGTFNKAYKLTQAKAKKIKETAITSIKNEAQRKNLFNELNEALDEMEAEKAKFRAIREYNSWSQALGWEEWYKVYTSNKNYAWKEYIGGCEYPTPTGWVKKAANLGHIDAAEEMYRREELHPVPNTTLTEILLNNSRAQEGKAKKIIEWHDKKRGLDEF